MDPDCRYNHRRYPAAIAPCRCQVETHATLCRLRSNLVAEEATQCLPTSQADKAAAVDNCRQGLAAVRRQRACVEHILTYAHHRRSYAG